MITIGRLHTWQEIRNHHFIYFSKKFKISLFSSRDTSQLRNFLPPSPSLPPHPSRDMPRREICMWCDNCNKILNLTFYFWPHARRPRRGIGNVATTFRWIGTTDKSKPTTTTFPPALTSYTRSCDRISATPRSIISQYYAAVVKLYQAIFDEINIFRKRDISHVSRTKKRVDRWKTKI